MSDSYPDAMAYNTGIAEMLNQGHEIDIVELDKSGNAQRRWLHAPDGRLTAVQDESKSNGFFSRSMREWRKALFDAFLPVGFPHSVSDDYLAYQTYDSLQAFFSTITSLLASRALLQGLGVGDASSSATFALLLTILKDAMSRVATILFAHRFGLRIEPDAKRYRFLADLFNDTAFFLELYSPYFGPWGKVVALGAGEGLRALCGVAAGASKAALSVHFAKHDNLAELNAKEASQETAVGLIGLLVGTLVVKSIEDHTSVVVLVVMLVFAHLWVNYLGVRAVCMTTLNRQRATIVFNEFLSKGTILSPAEVSARETIIFWSPVLRNHSGHDVARLEFAENYGHAMSPGRGGSNVYVVDGLDHTAFIPRGVPDRSMPIRLLLWSGAVSDARAAIGAWFKVMTMVRELDPRLGFTSQQFNKFNESHPKDNSPEGDEDDYETSEKPLGEQWWTGSGARELCALLITKGWDLSTQAFETKAPIRLTAQPAKRKDQ